MTPRPVPVPVSDTAAAVTRMTAITSARGAAAWGLDLARSVRPWPGDPGALAQVTFHEAAHHCATVAARMVLDGNDHHARTWAQAWSLLNSRADVADRARTADREARA